RVTPGKQKYLNSDGMSKGNYLFGLDHLPFDAREIVLVEGPLDAMWLYQHGYPGVAILGSSLSQAQVEIIKRRFWRVTIAFDGDRAGREGARKAARMLRGSVDVFVVRMPDGMDVQNMDAEELGQVFGNSEPVL